MAIRSWMISIMGLIGPKEDELFALQLELLYLTWFTLQHPHAYMMETADKIIMFEPKM